MKRRALFFGAAAVAASVPAAIAIAHSPAAATEPEATGASINISIRGGQGYSREEIEALMDAIREHTADWGKPPL